MAKVWKKLQRADSPYTGDVTGTIGGVANATVRSGAASGATANQETTANIRAGVTAANVGLGNVPNYSAATMRGGVTKTDVGLGSVANESRATILGGTFTGNVGGTSAADIRTKAIAGSAAKDAVDGNAAVTMVGGSINIGSGEWTVDANGNQVNKGTITINKDDGGDAGLTLNSGSSGDMKILMEGANPQIDLGGSAPLGTSSIYIRRGGTGNQARMFFTTGTTIIAGIGFANQPSANNDQFVIHYGTFYDNSSPYHARDFTIDSDHKMGFWQNDKTFAGLTIGTDGTNKGLYVKDGGVGIGGIVPDTYKLDVVGGYSNSSTTQSATAIAAFSAGASGSEMVIGGHQNGGTVWIQNRHKSVNGYAYEIAINPSGGNVGINLSDPAYALDVAGTFHVTGNATLTGNVGIGLDPTVGALHVEKSSSGAWLAYINNTHADGYGLKVKAGQNSGDYAFVIENQNSSNHRFKIDGAGDATFGGTVRVPDGSASEPTITNTGDTNTGIYFPSGDTLAFSTGGTERGYISGSGNLEFPNADLTIGTVQATSGSEAAPGLQLGGANDGFFHHGGIKVVCNNVFEFLLADGGSFHADGDVFAYSTSTTSDRRLKTDIVELESNLANIMNLEPVRFDWLVKNRGEDIGLIAQDVQKVIPEVVKEVEPVGETAKFLDDDTMLTVDYAKLVPVLIGAIQELKEEIEDLKENCSGCSK